jgi:hypothetical protein
MHWLLDKCYDEVHRRYDPDDKKHYKRNLIHEKTSVERDPTEKVKVGGLEATVDNLTHGTTEEDDYADPTR